MESGCSKEFSGTSARYRAMTFRPTTLERAYELAASGNYCSLTDIKATLKSEGFSSVREQLDGPSITKALRELCRKHFRLPASV